MGSFSEGLLERKVGYYTVQLLKGAKEGYQFL